MLDNMASLQEVDNRNSMDDAWYLEAYPVVALEIGEGYATSPADHFARIGRFRGYLPNAQAIRPEDAAAPPSRFGGMWTDFANAQDLLRGKHELGLVNDTNYELLTKWIKDGYVIIKNALPSEILEPAARDLDLAYSGNFPGVEFECVTTPPRLSPFLPHHTELPTKALDLHWFSAATQRAIFAPRIVEFLQAVFERRPMASQTLGFWRGSQQGSHQDSAYVSYTLNMHFCASWIAYEDVQPGAGELLYYPGSHKLSEYLYPIDQKNIVDAARLHPDRDIHPAIVEHVAQLPERASAAGLEEHTFIAKAGDVLIWSADLVHGGKPISNARTRKSMVTHYVPKEIAPLFFEQEPRPVRLFDDKFPYSTSVYSK